MSTILNSTTGRHMGRGAGGWPAYHFSDAEYADVYDRITSGEPISSVARDYGVHHSVIRRVFRAMAV